MLGAIIGDIAGSRFEFNPTNDYNFELFTRDCGFTDDTICTVARFDETCQGTVPVALWIIGQSHSFEDAVRRAVCLGADADTLGAIVGSIAEAIWGIPLDLKDKAIQYLPDEMKSVAHRFMIAHSLL